MKKSIFSAIILFLGLFLMPKSSFGGNIAGASITWERFNSSKDSILVHLIIYRDCNEVSISSQKIGLQACKQTKPKYFNLLMGVGKDITPVSKSSCTRCNKKTPNTSYGTSCSFAYGIEEFKYYGTVKFDTTLKNCCEYKLSWQGGNRPSAITTGPNDLGIYVSTTLNNCVIDKMSPTFSTVPRFIVLLNQCTQLDLSAYDNDINPISKKRDSLVYYLSKPMQDNLTSVSYSSGYGFSRPLKISSYSGNPRWNPPYYCEGFTINPQSGLLGFKAVKGPEISVISYIVESWGEDKSGNKIKKGTVTRDIEIIVIKAPNSAGVTLSALHSFVATDSICEGSSKCYTINSISSDTSDTLSIYWPYENNQFSIKNLDSGKSVKFPRTQVCFKTTKGMGRDAYYPLILTVQNQKTPELSFYSKEYRFYVNNTNFWQSPKDTSICYGDSVLIGPSKISNHIYSWTSLPVGTSSSSSQFFVNPTVNTSYILKDSVIGLDCRQTNIVKVNIKSNGCLNHISGQVKTSTGAYLTSSPVYLLKYNPMDSVVYVKDTAITDALGQYALSTLDSSSFIMARPDSAIYPHEVPTYYDSALDYQSSTNILTKGRIVKNFSTKYGIDSGIKGFIKGTVSYCYFCKTFGSGKIVFPLRMYLVDSKGMLIREFFTDSIGKFQVSNLSQQTYKIYVDRPFILNSLAPSIDLSTDARQSLICTLNRNNLTIDKITSIGNQSSTNPLSDIKIFPNPLIGNDLSIYGIPSNLKTISILDLNGKIIFKTETISFPNMILSIPKNVSSGKYIIEFQGKDLKKSMPLLVK